MKHKFIRLGDKSSLGKKVWFKSPNTGRMYECWIIHRTEYLPNCLALAKDYTEYDFRLTEGNTAFSGFEFPDFMLEVIDSKRTPPKWVRDQI